jgi:MoxR-like ATPase
MSAPGKTASLVDGLRGEIFKAVVGQAAVVEDLITAFAAGGHVLVEGVPGVAKTLLAKAFAFALDLDFKRVQFTPDLMPTDILGTNVWRTAEQGFQLVKGPVFTDVLLADEINRAPPKTQSALLEAMEERQVTIDGTAHLLGENFLVVATQNPVELEGTYPLPEAQTDRFLLKLRMSYPDAQAEKELLQRHHQGFDGHDLVRAGLKRILQKADIAELRRAVQAAKVDDTLFDYVVRLVGATRTSPQLRLGASPRAAVGLLTAAKARAVLRGSDFVLPDDVKGAARAVLRHRLVLRSEAEIEGIAVEEVIGRLLDEVEVPR